jgi:hypothetical protein
MEDDHGQRKTTWFLWEEGIKPSDIRHWLSAVYGEKAPACSTVFNLVWSFNSGRKLHRQLSIYLNNGSVKPCGNLQ